MANDSASGGFLAPTDTLVEDGALDLLFQPAIVGIAGLDGTLVRRKGQAIPGAQPARDVTWCAFAVTTNQADANPTILHDGAADGGLGRDIALRSVALEVTASFYGPAAVAIAERLRDGLGIAQNREALRAAGIAYVGFDRITFVPDFQNGQTIRRADLVFRARRMAVRSYAVRNILEVAGTVIASAGSRAGPVVVEAPFASETDT